MTRVILLADRLGAELRPMTQRCPVALLPVAAKPVVIHCIEDIATAGLRDVTLVVSEHVDLIRREIGNGARWGLRIDYFPSRGEEQPSDLLQRLDLPTDSAWLMLRGDVLRAPCLHAFLERESSANRQAPRWTSQTDRRAAALYLPRGRMESEISMLAWGDVVRSGVTAPTSARQGDGYFALLDDFRSYHQANLDAVGGRISGLILPGRQVTTGLTVGRRSSVRPRSLIEGVALIGSNTRIDARARLQGEVVVSDNVLIDRDADVRDSVILPDTYIGQLVDLRNALVFGADLIRVDTGAQLHINDRFLIASLASGGSIDYLARPLNRFAGLALLLCSLPLWPLALACALAQNGFNVMKAARLRGNRVEVNELGIRQRRIFASPEWQCSVPVLRHLPRILGVISGDLRFVGAMPITEDTAADRVEPWQREADRAPAGLIGPSQLLLPADATDDEVALSDAVYASCRSISQTFSYVGLGIRTLFSRVAWRG